MDSKRFVLATLSTALRNVKRDLALYLFILIYTVAALGMLSVADGYHLAAHALYPKQWTTMFLFLLPTITLSVESAYVIHRFDKRRKLAFRRMFSPTRMANLLSGMALLMGLMVFQGSFTSIKNVLPLLNEGFPYDQIQADIDAAIHFGTDPWILLHQLAGTEVAKKLIEVNYNIVWFVLCFGTLFYVCTSPRAGAVRTRYVIMFMLVWVVCGNVIAGLFLSAGPAFYGNVTGDDARFGEMLLFLAGSEPAQSSAHNFQQYLWSLHETGKAGFGSGISAFPSVHVALITMNALFAAEGSKKLGMVAAMYSAIIIVSSVYLGWHYAIDGYASVISVCIMFALCKRWLTERGDSTRGIAVAPLTRSIA